MSEFIVPKLALREMTGVVARRRLKPEVYAVLDMLAQRSGVVIEVATLTVSATSKDGRHRFTTALSPDIATEVLDILRELSPEVHDDDEG